MALRITLAAFLLVAVGGEASDLHDVRIRLEHIGEGTGQLYLGEPLELDVTTVNEGVKPLRGYFKALASSPSVTFYLRRMDGSVYEMNESLDSSVPGLTVCRVRTTTVLGPQKSVTHRVRFLLDPRTKVPWLAEQGEYEVSVAVRPFDGMSSEEIRSEPLRIGVQRPPDHLRAAYEEYRSLHLDALVSSPERWLSDDPRSALVAESFVATFADTTYGRHVRSALLRGLQMRSANGLASQLEREAYRRLANENDVEIQTVPGRR